MHRLTRYLHALTLVTALAFTDAAHAAEQKGWFGLGVNVEVEGISLNPTLQSITIAKVIPSSPAAAAGLTAGDQIVEIQGMAIPGAKAKEVKAAMQQTVGSLLRLRVKHGATEPRAFTLIAVAKP